jgi:tetratricopeptide (TPR) repeat protein
MIGEFLDWDWRGAEAAFREAIRLKSDYAEAHLELSMLLMRRRRFGEALSEAHQTVYSSPVSARFEVGVGEVYLYSGRYDDALAAANRALALDSSIAGAHLVMAYAYGEQQRYAEAAAAAAKCIALGWDVHGRAMLGSIYTRSSRRAEAQQIIDVLQARWRTRTGALRDPDIAIGIAQVYAGLREKQRALDWLEQGARKEMYMVYLGIDPTFKSLVAEPRFRALLERVGLDE